MHSSFTASFRLVDTTELVEWLAFSTASDTTWPLGLSGNVLYVKIPTMITFEPAKPKLGTLEILLSSILSFSLFQAFD